MTTTEIQSIVKEAVAETINDLVRKGHLLRPATMIKQAEVHRRYPRRRVTDLIKQGYLHPVKDTEGGSKWFDVAELEEVMRRNNVLERFKLPKKPKMKKTLIKTAIILLATAMLTTACGSTVGVSKNYKKSFGSNIGNRLY